MRIAVDAMGGDHAPTAIVDGAVAAARQLGVPVTLVGAEAALAAALARHDGWQRLPLAIVDAPEAVGMADAPVAALRRRPRASISVAAELVAHGEADAIVSAGNTGATVMAAHATFGMMPGVDRPALATVVPTRGRPAVLLDAGANAECRPQHLLQFAIMGAVHARLALGVERPRVALLSIGEEETKGNELTREAHRLLKAAPVHFIGNIEGREIYSGDADVIVCDGFTGNIVLKTSEGLVEVVDAVLGDALRDVPAGRESFERFRRRMDYSEYGGALLLGVSGLVVVGHGRSSPMAVQNAIGMAARFTADGFVRRLEREIAAATVS
jgi:glycerol-3-phosphate acyltransferase PlsX